MEFFPPVLDRPERERTHFPLSSVKDKKGWPYSPISCKSSEFNSLKILSLKQESLLVYPKPEYVLSLW